MQIRYYFEHVEFVRSIPLYCLELRTVVYNALYRYGVRTFGELCEMSDSQLYSIRVLGKSRVFDIKREIDRVCSFWGVELDDLIYVASSRG